MKTRIQMMTFAMSLLGAIIRSRCLIGRQRIKIPESGAFYDVIDFNIGENVVLFGRNFHITNCDTFTRNFLRRLGVRVAEPLSMPSDPYLELRNGTMKSKSKSSHKI
ncbi:EF-hand domain-containing family member C2-like [Diaphorina citri]|uniref:EF-hand domain-containing family member C2-like n=1 Tax=Diaphorina citri TaxID=121845 RepID=A0A1S3D7E4_DIACI|nr:EF-hand domain-containing family member C2-like [Diaphorina citri]